MKLEKTLVDLSFGGKSITGLTAKNTMGIKYTLKSENNSVIRDLEIDDSGNYFIEADENDLATFSTQYPETLVEGLYWGKGWSKDGRPADSDYLYTSEDTVKVSNGVALDDLEVNRLNMLLVYIRSISVEEFTLKSISINGVEVAKPDALISGVTELNLASYIENYMSYNTTKPLEYSVVVNTTNGDTTLTESVDLSAGIMQVHVLLDGSTIQ